MRPLDEQKILTETEMKRIIEAVLFAAGHPVAFAKLAEVMNTDAEEVRRVVTEYKDEYDGGELPRGIQLLILGNACQIVTKEVFSEYIKNALGIKDGGNLSRASLETLAIIAYNQPVTRGYVEQVRGVESSYSVGALLERELICEMGRLEVPGRPRLYGTTEKFLRIFGLSSLEELPPVTSPTGENI